MGIQNCKSGFDKDIAALEWCEVCVLLLPCGRSAHLELGRVSGKGKRTAILLPPEDFYRLEFKKKVTKEQIDQLRDDWDKLGTSKICPQDILVFKMQDDFMIEPELMYKMADRIVDSVEELTDWLQTLQD